MASRAIESPPRVFLDRLGGLLRDHEVVVPCEFDLLFGGEGDVGDAGVGLRVDVPVEAHGHFARADAAVKFDRRLLELEPVFGRFGNLDVEIHVGLYLDVEVARAVRRVVGDGDLLVVDADEVVEAFLRDGDLLFDPSVLLHDADYAAAGLVGQG